ncbi:hypothetical protein DAVIS_03907 [Mycobacterium marinum]|uniref:Uncharacterized protein n=1 Tax=Mycobacterium marinum TaxID=1781 RepID=A0A3E2MSF3_MYCMR|nr:hypothetical protein DAVIS_03907 [Mycobacterium marinum]
MAAIAGAFCPNRFDSTRDTKLERLTAISSGCTVAATADSNAPTTASACADALDAWVAAVFNHPAYGAAAASIALAAGPCQAWAANSAVVEENDCAAASSSEAKAFQAAEASNMGAEPAPANINAELISGGNAKKLIAHYPFPQTRPRANVRKVLQRNRRYSGRPD